MEPSNEGSSHLCTRSGRGHDRGGTFLQFGVSAEQAVASWSPYKIYNHEITITGSMAVLHSFERAADLFARGVLDADLMISDRFALDDYPRALEQFKSGIGRKIQVTTFGKERNV